ncbi:MAG: cell surface protein SprA [Candidatus Marinimicrobia bacterium]|nr:cell surface protein SprA [Candidatus Neomarinimicrobiota bacterium]
MNEKEADIKKAFQKPRLVAGLVVIMMFSLIWGESSDFSAEFNYSFQIPGFTSMFSQSPKGFTRGYEHPTNPISVNFPKWFSNIRIYESASDSGKVLVMSEKIGENNLYSPRYIPFSEYFIYKKSYDLDNMWYTRVAMTDTLFFFDALRQQQQSNQSLEIIGADIAGQRVALRIRGLISITGKYNQQNNSIMATGNMENEQKNFLMDQTQRFTIEGTIGDRITISIDEDSERDFEFENAIKINYKGKEDEIVQRANFGNIGLSLPGTQFVTGSSSSSGLFGGKAIMKLGPINVTAIASYEKKDSKKKSWGGGSDDDGGSTIQIFDYEYKRNTYFYINEIYRENMYPVNYRDNTFSYIPSNRIIEYELYISCNEREDTKIKAIAFVDIASNGTATVLNEHAEEDVADSIYFKRLEPSGETNPYGEYNIDENLGYIRMNMGLGDDNILAIAYKTSDGKVYGDINSGSFLKIIKAENSKPSYITWDLEMKNIYDLKARNIDKEGFDLKIFINNNQPKELHASGDPYIKYFNLDNYDQSGLLKSDGKVDIKPSNLFIDLTAGELWIPYARPFQAPPEGDQTEGIYNDSLRSSTDPDLPSAGNIYTLPYTDNDRKERKYYIEAKYSNRSSTIDLGEMFIIEGSEEILINGKKMTKGVDYDIDYFSGLITLKSAEAMDPDAKVDINYETEQLFGGIGEQKLMAGMRAEYKISEKAFIGATAMYYNRSVLDDKNVNIGDEPFKNFIWDVNGEFEYNLNWLDRAMNALPFVHIKQPSRIKVSGEIAQILPNPNTIENEESGDFNGVAKLDDFESASQKTPMNVNFQKWTHASKPVNTFFSSSFKERGFLFWYNPFYVGADGTKVFGMYTKYIWPQKETTETDQYTNVLSVVLDPEVNGITGHETQNDVRQVWGGIMQPVYMYDQSKSKYIELWVKGNKGQLQVDIGEISEDWYNVDYDPSLPEEGDGKMNYEDKDLNGNLQISQDYTEDTGINGLTDEEELARGWDPLIDNFDKEGYKEGEVRFCNGSEDNAGTDGIQPYPETEDIDRDGKLDQANNYYSYTLDLSSDEWLASKTRFNNGGETGWKQYRIPLTAVIDSVGKPSFQSIRMMRLNVFSMADQDTLQFASISIVGNEWQEIGLADEETPFYTVDDDRFFITVKNSDEDDDYISPPGISGREQIDPLGGSTITEKEQALVLNFIDLKPGETALAEKIMLENETLLMYKKLKMFVHGPDYITDEESRVSLFLRIGRGDMTEYYETVTEVYDGWDERNNIEIIFDEITQLKKRIDFDGVEYFVYDEGNIREYRPIDEVTGEYIGKIYRVVGNPSLSRIEKMQLGVTNIDLYREYTGDIWVNEMRVVESNNDPGMAMRGSFDLKLGGLMNFNANAKKTDADFRQVNQQMSSKLTTTETFNMNLKIYANKIFPEKWKMKFPVAMSQSQSTNTPKYFPGSDILVGDNPDDSLKVITKRQSINTSLSRSGNKNDPLLTRLLVNPVSASFNASHSKNSSLEIASRENTTLSGKISYSLSIDKGKGISYLSWIPFLDEKTKEQKFYWKPTSFKWNMNVSKKEEDRISRSTMDTSSTYSFGMSKSMNISFTPFSPMKITYQRSSSSDLLDYKNDILGLFTDITYDSLMNGVNIGDVTSLRENLAITYNPILAEWLKPRLSYNSNYSYRAQKDQYYAGVGVTRKYSVAVTLTLKQVWDTYEKKFTEMSKKREKAKKPAVQLKKKEEPEKLLPKGADGDEPQDNEPGSRRTQVPKKKDQGHSSKKITKKKLTVSELFGKINPIRFNYTDNLAKTNRGITGSDTIKIYKDVSYKYRYGLGDYYYLPTGTYEGSLSNPNNNDRRISFTIGSGVKLTKSITLNLNYKQNTSSGPEYQFKTSSDDYYDEFSHIITYGDTLELIRSDSSASRGYIPLGETGQDGFAAPDYSLTWRINPSQYKWLNGKLNFIKSINLQHKMSGKESIRYKLQTDAQPYYMKSTSSTYTLNFTPLIKASFVFKGNLRADVGYNKTIKIDHQGDAKIDYLNTSIIKNYQDNMTLNVSYEYNKGISIPVPFLKKIQVINMENEITFSLQGKYGLNKKVVKNKNDIDFGAPKDFRINWELEPQVSYRFSKNIDGRLFFKYGQRIDMNQQDMEGENKFDDYKDFGITVTIRISG